MNHKSMITLVSVVLVMFVLVKVIVMQLCAPTQNSVVGNAVTTIANAVTAPASSKAPARPDPFSWEPIMHQLLGFFSKACER